MHVVTTRLASIRKPKRRPLDRPDAVAPQLVNILNSRMCGQPWLGIGRELRRRHRRRLALTAYCPTGLSIRSCPSHDQQIVVTGVGTKFGRQGRTADLAAGSRKRRVIYARACEVGASKQLNNMCLMFGNHRLARNTCDHALGAHT